ncbi:urea ABC transporter, permease protein UrtC [Novosphingobium nitrogenifigens DSM 19370]|uniref:Urea ABC transporter, permease protein UrtC n=1 Tax=Novosphingobium nitrogenifigens DSM 19370 TaxID=983920 RepID=F1Z457_9SPHN|nr:urea ABC transporter, permease protein UrtC [Novosphingobium nitrogenifigens DSM 19370]
MLFALAAAIPFGLSDYDTNLVARFLAMGIVALGIVLTWGHGGILSLGQGVFFGLGGYAIAMHIKLADLAEGEIPDFMQWSGRTALPFWWEPFHSPVFALAAALVGPALVAALFAWAVFHRRVSGTYFALITQALALAFATLIISRQDVTGGFNGLTNFTSIFGFLFAGPGMASALYWITLGALALSWLGLRWLLGSRFGTVLRAARDGENRVRFLGYDPVPFKVAAFALAAMLSGLGGALFTLNAGVISPALIGVAPSIEMVVWVAIGGRTSLGGAIFGALAVNLARDAISSSFPEGWLYVMGALFILVVTLFPQGLAGLLSSRSGKRGENPA